MIISVLNHSNGKLSDEAIQQALRAINRQIAQDFEPYWSLGATLRLEGRSQPTPGKQNPADLRGDAVLYIWDKSDVKGALGYHDRNNSGLPYSFIFLDVCQAAKESWTVTLSHEALEMIADCEVNLLVMGPHPANPKKTVFHWYEMCDAVQGDSYTIDGVEVSNFVLPLYFTGGDEFTGRNDFLGKAYNGKTLKSFGVNPGGYIGFYNPETGGSETYMMAGDRAAARRAEAKMATLDARRSGRHAVLGAGRTVVPASRRTKAKAPLAVLRET